jgi:hypothetical protein
MNKPKLPLTETEQERAKVLHASGKTPTYIAKGMGRSHHTLQKFLDKPEVREQVGIQREVLAGMCDSIAHRVMSAVTAADVEKASLKDKMISTGIAIEKAALLRGEIPVTVNVSVLLDLVAAAQEMRRVNDERLQAEHAAHAEEAARPQLTITGNVQ